MTTQRPRGLHAAVFSRAAVAIADCGGAVGLFLRWCSAHLTVSEILHFNNKMQLLMPFTPEEVLTVVGTITSHLLGLRAQFDVGASLGEEGRVP